MTVSTGTQATRDAGLVRSIGPWGLTASTINIVIGAGIFALPGAIAAAIGAYAPLAFLACAIAMGAVAYCFAEGGRRIATSGGCYGYIETAFGPRIAFITAIVFVVSNCLACAGIISALSGIAAALVPPELAVPARVAAVLGVIGLIATVNIRGVTAGTRFIGVVTALKLVPLVVFVVAGIHAVDPANFVLTSGPSVGGVGRALILGVFAFTGMESPLSASGEVRDPGRTIPIALLSLMLVITALYVSIQLVAQGILGASLAGSATPLADAMAHVHPALRTLLLAGAAVSMFGWIGSDLLSAPRMLFALGRDGLLPTALGTLHTHTHAPYVAILWYAAAAAVLALSGTFAELAVLATLGSAAIYIAGCAAVWQLARRVPNRGPGGPVVSGWLRVAVVVGILSMTLTIALGSWSEIGGLAVLITVSAGGYWQHGRWSTGTRGV